MKKVIKYRVFDISIGWVTNAVMLSSNGECFFKNNLTKDIGDCYVEFFTGVLDKNGKEIYEGDIIKIFDHPQPEIVEFEGSCFGFWKHSSPARRSGVFENIAEYTSSEGYEVLGNFHENAKILRNKKCKK